MSLISRRSMLRAALGTSLLVPFGGLLRTAAAGPLAGQAKRIIFFNFPDGVGVADQRDAAAVRMVAVWR